MCPRMTAGPTLPGTDELRYQPGAATSDIGGTSRGVVGVLSDAQHLWCTPIAGMLMTVGVTAGTAGDAGGGGTGPAAMLGARWVVAGVRSPGAGAVGYRPAGLTAGSPAETGAWGAWCWLDSPRDRVPPAVRRRVAAAAEQSCQPGHDGLLLDAGPPTQDQGAAGSCCQARSGREQPGLLYAGGPTATGVHAPGGNHGHL